MAVASHLEPVAVGKSGQRSPDPGSAGDHLEQFFLGIGLMLFTAALAVAAASVVLHEDLGGALTFMYLLFAALHAVFLSGFCYLVLGSGRSAQRR